MTFLRSLSAAKRVENYLSKIVVRLPYTFKYSAIPFGGLDVGNEDIFDWILKAQNISFRKL
ncbi:hypothetical protein, partial [Thiolapillus sp.]